MEDAADLLWALNALTTSSPRAPLAVVIDGGKIRVTDLMDKPIASAKVSLTRAVDAAGNAVKVKEGVLASAGSGLFTLPSIPSGVYKLSFAVEADPKQSGTVTRAYVSARTAPKLTTCEVQIFTDVSASDAQTLK